MTAELDEGPVGTTKPRNPLRDPQDRAQLVEALATGIQRYFARNPPLARSRQL